MNLYPITAHMPEESFWGIIGTTLTAATAAGDDPDAQDKAQNASLAALLSELDWQDVLAFENRFNALHRASYTSHLWCAAYLMCGGCSDDGFDYFRYWLISRGEAVYRAAISNPDSLAAIADPENDDYEREDIAYIARDIFAEKTGGAEIYEYLSPDERDYPDITFDWEEDDPVTMQRLCPRLYAMFWE